jgi:hypothetical protein
MLIFQNSHFQDCLESQKIQQEQSVESRSAPRREARIAARLRLKAAAQCAADARRRLFRVQEAFD